MATISTIKALLGGTESGGFRVPTRAPSPEAVRTPASSSSSSRPSEPVQQTEAVKVNLSASGSSSPVLTKFNRNGGTSVGDSPSAVQNAGNRQTVGAASGPNGGANGYFGNSNRREAISQGAPGQYSVLQANREAIKSESQIQTDSKSSGLKDVISNATKVTANSTKISESVQDVIAENRAAASPSIDDVAKVLASAKPVNQLKPGGSI